MSARGDDVGFLTVQIRYRTSGPGIWRYKATCDGHLEWLACRWDRPNLCDQIMRKTFLRAMGVIVSRNRGRRSKPSFPPIPQRPSTRTVALVCSEELQHNELRWKAGRRK
jgi:hypothetical protein